MVRRFWNKLRIWWLEHESHELNVDLMLGYIDFNFYQKEKSLISTQIDKIRNESN